MIKRKIGALAVAVFAWQAGAQAANLSACQNVNGVVCGAGNGVISSVRGDISVGRGGAIAQANEGSSVFAGDRILARDGLVQVRLGPGCLTSVGANSVAAVTQQNGLTCLAKGSDLTQGRSAAEVPNPAPAFDPLLVGAGVVAVGGTALACGLAFCNHHGHTGQFAFPVSP
jgi:hypothetical protein